MEFSGRLNSFPPADLLQWAKHERRTGALMVRRTDREKRVFFRAGEVIACISTDPAEFFGQHLLNYGLLDQRTLFQALSESNTSGVRLGSLLVEKGLLPLERVQEALTQQIGDMVCDLFLWTRGVFYFRSEVLADEDVLAAPLHTLGLAMEGTRWQDELARIRRVFVDDDVVIRRGVAWPGERLPPLQKRIVGALEDRATVEALYRQVRGSYFRFLEACFHLCIAEVLDVESTGLDRVNPMNRSQEMSVLDLLLEQATEDQVLMAGRHMVLPLELLERFFPIWVEELAEEEQKRMPGRAREFYHRFDGRTSLGESFSADPAQRGREMDLLLLQLRKGQLALLPAPVDRLEKQADQRGEPETKRWWRRLLPESG
jgi:hypothetical protein